MNYIKQRTDNDCGTAMLAMVCDMRYEDVAAYLLGEDCGINDSIVKDFLFHRGYFWQERVKSIWRGTEYVDTLPWPPMPFAPRHICLVQATRGWHYCAMGVLGEVYDPWNEDRKTLLHPDYYEIGSVIGVFKLGDFR